MINRDEFAEMFIEYVFPYVKGMIESPRRCSKCGDIIGDNETCENYFEVCPTCGNRLE